MGPARVISGDLFGLDFGFGLGGGSAAGGFGPRGVLAAPFALFTADGGGGRVLETVFGSGVEAKLAQPNVGVGGDGSVCFLTEDAGPASLA